jgi:hypothetical protein
MNGLVLSSAKICDYSHGRGLLAWICYAAEIAVYSVFVEIVNEMAGE